MKKCTKKLATIAYCKTVSGEEGTVKEYRINGKKAVQMLLKHQSTAMVLYHMLIDAEVKCRMTNNDFIVITIADSILNK